MRRPDFLSRSSDRRSARQRAADALVAELTHASLLVRHVALCRLVHAGDYRSLSPAVLRRVAGCLGTAVAHGSAASLLNRLALLLEAELARTSGRDPSASVDVELLRAAAVGELAGHGYRTVHGALPNGWGR
jgi:hypothetical protein